MSNQTNDTHGLLGGLMANGLRPTWGNIAVVTLFIAAIAGWFIGYGGYREKVAHLEKQIILMRARLMEVEKWQRDWPSQGELIMDRAQNTRIEELLRRVDRLELKANSSNTQK